MWNWRRRGPFEIAHCPPGREKGLFTEVSILSLSMKIPSSPVFMNECIHNTEL